MPPRPAPRPRPAALPARPGAASPAARAEAGGRLGDWVWRGLGAAAAAGSAGFATYALIFSTGEVVPSGDFNLFGHYDRSASARSAQHAAPSGAAETAARDEVDPTPTGSLAPAASPAEPGGAGGGRRGADGPLLPAFTLRDVFDGKALVESRASLSVVKPGSVLDGAGEVLSIEKRGEHWVVLTRNGVIAGQRR